jgi:hypothetical protein
MRRSLLLLALLAGTGGCALVPEISQEPQFHNPFPQLMRVAVLPFYNQSSEPTVNGDEVALAYHDELQKIRGFEVMPVGTARQLAAASRIELQAPADYQKLARFLGVDAVVVGSVTDFSEYYPPRMGLAVNWYTANPCFHPIPPGYGLPWGTSEEEYIPPTLMREAEFALAREQLKTQTPDPPATDVIDEKIESEIEGRQAQHTQSVRNPLAPPAADSAPLGEDPANTELLPPGAIPLEEEAETTTLPPDWPDPRGFVPPPPSPEKPVCRPHYGPIISQVRQYDGADGTFTEALAGYYYFRDDARFGGWQSYLQRKDDFYRFCCYLHITEMLTARGGADETRVAIRWPVGRYTQ